ncbi:hypothetical protein [Desulfomonile tiedjei]|uniref:SprT-like domain-containing protein n=1 Tax=Desulfomonile tiedjei (strain ATCC 49306 / DSM 6799 / DCB-1) TaxID=706587 RepID=I4C8Y7_DESTA|nr:hypothetical protein [Desulfomonile tiedjei]AFM26028.1 hypothetical protein Desti_3373 [Desulfomonile tiedjei DSM 6799]
MNTVKAEYDYIRSTFFPKWNRKGEWKLEIVPRFEDTNDEGFCDWTTKTIKICANPEMPIQVLLIHEIAHAVSRCRDAHQTPWLTRMEKAAKKADTIGMKDLAQMIRNDRELYTDVPVFRPSLIYNAITDAVVAAPQADFDQIINHVNEYHGNYSKQEFLKKFKRARQVYEKKKKEVLQQRGSVLTKTPTK